MGQLQRVPVLITGFITIGIDETIKDIQERIDNNTISLDFNDNDELIEIEHATINEQE